MPGAVWAIGEVVDGQATRLSMELATLARLLAADAGAEAATVLIGAGATEAAAEVARYGPAVLAVESDATVWSTPGSLAPLVARLVEQRAPEWLLVGASPNGRDAAGLLHGLLEWPILVNASEVRWEDGGPSVRMNTFGGRLVTRSAFTGERGIVVVRPASVTAEEAAAPGPVETVTLEGAPTGPAISLVERVAEASVAAPIEEARVIVAGGRGVGDREGFRLVEELAETLGGAVGATRAVVDAGWVPYSQQIGQTGRIVKPALYIAAGISGAIQHKVGMQTAETIVAINKDPDAPITGFADLVVVGDLFQILPPLTQAIRARQQG